MDKLIVSDTAPRLQDILKSHRDWLLGRPGGIRADLSEANLSGANLSGADLSWVKLSGANLSGAIGAVCAGTDPRGHRFVGVSHPDGPRISARGRFFTIDQAKAYWADNPDALARVALIETLLSTPELP